MDGHNSARDWIGRIVTILKRTTSFWMRAALVMVVGGACAVRYGLTRPRVYKSETIILYRETIRGSDLGAGDSGHDPARKLGMRLKEMIFSRTSLQQIVDEFNLYRSIVDDRGYVDAVDEMRAHIAFRVRDGDTFGLSFEGDSPKAVQKVTARLAEALLEEHSKHRVQQATILKEFLDSEAERNGKDLKEKESALAKFVSAHPEFAKVGMPAVGGPAVMGVGSPGVLLTAPRKGASPTTPKDSTLLALERQLERIDERLGAPAAPRPETPPPKDNKLLNDAEAELKAAQKDLADKLSHYTEQHPDVRAAQARARAAEVKVQAAASSGSAAPVAVAPEVMDEAQRNALKEERSRVAAEIASYRAQQRKRQPAPLPAEGPMEGAETEELSTGAGRILGLESEWARLQREVGEVRQRQQGLEDRVFKAAMTASSVTSERNAQMRVLDPAFLPTHPAKPGRAFLVGVGLAISLGLSIAVALGSALLDERIYDRADIDRLGLIPLVGVVPRLPSRGRGRRRG